MSRLIASSDVTFALGYTPANQTALSGYVLSSSLAAVATTGQYSDLLGKPAAFLLSPATVSAIGGVKPGTGLTVASDGTLSVTASGTSSYVLPVASVSQLGGVKQGVNVSIASDGTISAASGSSYTLPPATASALGGVKVGTGLAVATDGTLSTTGTGGTTYTLPIGSATVLGGYKVGTGLAVATDGTLSTSAVTSAAITTALGFTPYSAANPSGYQTASQVTAVLPAPATVAPLAAGTATVGTSALYARQDHVHPAYVLGIASTSALGGVKVGTGLAVATDGTLSTTGTGGTAYSLPQASGTVLGGVKIGANVTVAADGTISVASPSAAYVLPIGSATALGGYKVGNGLAVATDGTLSTTGSGGTAYTLPTASATVLGGIKVGTNLSIATDGTLSATATGSSASPATVAPLANGTAAVGTSTFYARQDHVHPTDTSRYAASNPSGFQTAGQVSAAVVAATGRNVRTITVAGNVTMATSDYFVGLNKTTGAATTVTLPPGVVAGTQVVVKDMKQDSDLNPITVVSGDTNGTIDKQTSLVIGGPNAYPGGSATFLFGGAEWSLV